MKILTSVIACTTLALLGAVPASAKSAHGGTAMGATIASIVTTFTHGGIHPRCYGCDSRLIRMRAELRHTSQHTAGEVDSPESPLARHGHQ